MAPRHSLARPLRSAASVLRQTKPSSTAARAFTTSATRPKDVASDTPNMRHAQRGPQGRLHVPIVNPAGMKSSGAP